MSHTDCEEFGRRLARALPQRSPEYPKVPLLKLLTVAELVRLQNCMHCNDATLREREAMAMETAA